MDQFRDGWTETDDGTDGAALTVTRTAATNKAHFVSSYMVTISSGTTTAGITVELRDGSTVKWKDTLKSGATIGDRVGMVFREPIRMTPNTAVNLVVSDPGDAGTVTANIAGFTE